MPDGQTLGTFPITIIEGGRRRSGRLSIAVEDGQPVCWVDGEIGLIVAPKLRTQVIEAYEAARAASDRALGPQSFSQSAGDEPA